MKKSLFTSVFALCFLSHCQQAGSGDTVKIPAVEIVCTSSNCAAGPSQTRIFIYITTSGCLNINYGYVATGTGTVACTGSGCSGTPTMTWTNLNHDIITEVASDSYDFCGVIDSSGGYGGDTFPAGDSTTTSNNVSVGTLKEPVSTINLTNWSNGNFTN